VDATDNRGAIVAPFIGSYDGGKWAVKEREVTAVEF
jgi:hypothetical protein